MHAAIQAAREGIIPPDGTHPHLVFCTTTTEWSLEVALRRLRAEGVRLVAFREPDLDDALTAICTGPVTSDRRRLFRRFPLFNPSPTEIRS
jgi:hypothetical protein